MIYFLIKDIRNNILNVQGNFNKDISPVSLKLELILSVDNYQIIRIKVFGKYLTNNLDLSENKDDNTIFIKKGEYLLTKDNYLLINNENKLDKYIIEDISWTFKVISIKYPENYYEKLMTDGIITFKISEDKMQYIKKARDFLHNSEHIRISNLLVDDLPYMGELIDDQNLKNILEKVYPNGYHLTTYSSNTVSRGQENNVFWHTDYPYHSLSEPYDIDKVLSLQVIVTIDDFKKENGSTQYIRGSHQNRFFPRNINHNDNIENVETEAGIIIIFIGSLWHSQGINYTDNKRSALLANFSPLYIPSKDKFEKVINPFYIKEGKVLYIK